MKGKKPYIFLLMFCLINFSVYSEDPTEDELREMLKQNLITQEDYDILTENKSIQDGEGYFELKVNGDSVTKNYSVEVKKGKMYFPLKEFFKDIEFTNYSVSEDKEIKMYLGETLREVVLTPKEFRMDGKTTPISPEDIFYENDDIYLSEDVFKEMFLKTIRVDDNSYIIAMYLNFASPEEIKIRISRTKEKLEEERDIHTLLYTSKPQLFELGYLRTKLAQIYERKVEPHSSKTDWEGELEYQGAFLYGEINAGYDLKNKEFEDVTLRYNEIYEKHTLEFANYQVGNGGAREWGGSFKKDKGYIVTSDKRYIIKENVPIGSRVELLYLGFPIDVQDAQNGVVVFENPEIKANREYYLKIYDPNGKIYMKKINTTTDYNQQNKGQFEYDISFREDDESKKTRLDSKIFYGLTNNLTLGVGYDRDIEEVNKKYNYVDSGSTEVVWSDSIFSYPYVVSYEKKKTFTKLYDESKNRNYKNKNEDVLKAQLDIKNFRFKVDNKYRDKYYDEKREEEYTVEYRPFRSLELEYGIERNRYYENSDNNDENERRKREKFKASFSKSIKSLLMTAEYEKRSSEDPEYSLNLYYNGLRTQSMRLENKWTNGGKDFETGFTIFTSSNRAFDYTFEARYSEKTKEYMTFKFDAKYDNWFSYTGEADKKGNQRHKIGLDRVTDLKYPFEKIESLSSSRVRIVTFIDINDNNIYDEFEPRIDNVKVKIGEKEIYTNEQGEGMFYGIPNHIDYLLNPVIRKPSFSIGNNKIKIRGKTSSTLTAYIPVKPLLSLTGLVNVDPVLGKTDEEKIAMYGDILVKVKDKTGKIIDMAIPDEMGIFEISGLLPKEYFLEVSYIGLGMNIKKLEETVKLKYLNSYDSKENTYTVNISDKNMSLEKSEEE